jgi:hypothetical protein
MTVSLVWGFAGSLRSALQNEANFGFRTRGQHIHIAPTPEQRARQ